MKKKILLVSLCAVCLVGLFFALRAIFPLKTVKLDPPNKIYLKDYALSWETVDRAQGYRVDVGGEIIFTTDAGINLKFADNGKTVRISAVGDGDRWLDSDFGTPFTVEYAEDIESRVPFVYRKLIVGGVTVREEKEFYYGTPISAAPADYTDIGYNFEYWYTYEDDRSVIVEQDFLNEDGAVLYAHATPIVYTVSYVADGFDLPEDAPYEYTVDVMWRVASVTAKRGGYRIVGWYTDEERTKLLNEYTTRPDNFTLYARVELSSPGLVFEECDGGYAVADYTGTGNAVEIPATYNGLPVLTVKEGALRKNGVEEIVFYGDVTLEGGAIDSTGDLKSIRFFGSVAAEENAIRIMLSTEELRIEIYGKPSINEAFIAGYLGVLNADEVTVFVKEQYFSELFAALNGIVTVSKLS